MFCQDLVETRGSILHRYNEGKAYQPSNYVGCYCTGAYSPTAGAVPHMIWDAKNGILRMEVSDPNASAYKGNLLATRKVKANSDHEGSVSVVRVL